MRHPAQPGNQGRPPGPGDQKSVSYLGYGLGPQHSHLSPAPSVQFSSFYDVMASRKQKTTCDKNS